MEHDGDWYMDEEPEVASAMPPEEIVCDSDLACPSRMVCEPVSCCEAEHCDCPAAICAYVSTGAQGRDCEEDADCGADFACLFDQDPSLGWCEAQDTPMPTIENRDALERMLGCQGGTDHGLPLSVAIALLFGAVLRGRPLAL